MPPTMTRANEAKKCKTCEGKGGITNYVDGIVESSEPCPDCPASPAPSKPEVRPWAYAHRFGSIDDSYWVIEQTLRNGQSAQESMPLYWGADYDAKCAEVERLESYVRSLPADWFKDSSLKTWFPITAMQIEDYQSTIATLKAEVEQLREYGMKRDSELALSQSQLAEAQRDAGRYRWLRKGEPNRLPASTASMSDGCGPHVVQTLPGVQPQDMHIWGEWLDSTIDAQLALTGREGT